MVKYNADWEIMNTYDSLQIVWSQFFTDKPYFINIQFNLNIWTSHLVFKLKGHLQCHTKD